MMNSETKSSKFSIKNLFSALRQLVTQSNEQLAYFYDVVDEQAIDSFGYEGEQVVALSQVVGSMNEGRCHDFDKRFKLVGKHSKERLDGVKLAGNSKQLPPVSLIKVGSSFFVQDGHHRISWMNANGQSEILAKVTAVSLKLQPAF